MRRVFSVRFELTESLYVKKLFLYSFPRYPFKKKSTELQAYLFYNAYQTNFRWLKYKFFNRKYHKIISLIHEKLSFVKRRRAGLYQIFKKKSLRLVYNFFSMYKTFFALVSLDVFYFLKRIKHKKKRLMYYLILSFRSNRLFVNLLTFNKKNHLSLSSGLFIKFFEKKKAFKRNKTIKLLIAKYLRKIFLLSKIKNLILIVKNNPVHLLEIINFMNTPIVHKFFDPSAKKIIDEKKTPFTLIQFFYFIFLENKNFSTNKTKKKGRVKRKILRKLVINDNVTD